MKTGQILKVAVLPILTVFTLVSVPKTARADYLTSEGYGGEYRYELWSSDNGKEYHLKIWDKNQDTKKDNVMSVVRFESSRKALNYFDCYYAHKSLPECPKSR
ncbi:MAG: hypothetical protein ACK44G_17115 [Aphanizomenon sp.]